VSEQRGLQTAGLGSPCLETRLGRAFAGLLVVRLLYPFFNSPLTHLASDPLRHWQTGIDFLHPDVMGGGDPFLYQLWLCAVHAAATASDPVVPLACGVLCAAMPHGWYRALREVLPRERSLWGAIVIGLIPGFLGIYGYFMTETLLLTLTGYAFWLTLRAHRKRTVAAFAWACAVWLAASHTRIVVVPMAAVALGWVWLEHPQKVRKALAAGMLAALITIPAGLHARAGLGFFSPLGNLYLNEIYHDSGRKDIHIDYGVRGHYGFGSPSYYNPTFYPLSDWTTHRSGAVDIVIDTRNGRADWIREKARIHREGPTSGLRERWEDLLYLLFAGEWPDSNRDTFIGALTLWSRWLFVPLVAAVLAAVVCRRYRGRQWLLPASALGMVALLALQSEGPMEGRFRKPIEPVLVAALLIALARKIPVSPAT
jgi:hypothetical protein